jgi:DNA-binding MarR family transcriptional regulator
MDIVDKFEMIIPVYINRLHKNMQKIYDDLLKPYGLSKFHAFYLMFLMKYDKGLKLNELNDKIGCDKANTSRAIMDMENKGIIIREVNTDCEKKFIVKLTNKGFDIANKFKQMSRDCMQNLFGKLSNKEQEDYSKLTEKMLGIKEIMYDSN